MWLDKENAQDPYNRLSSPATPIGGNQSVGAGGGVAGAPQSTSGTQSNPSTQNPVAPQQPDQKFASVQDYLGANKQQGEDLGQKVVGDLGTQAGQIKDTIGQAATGTQNDINAGTTAFNSDLVNKAKADPNAVASDPDQLKSFLGQWNAAYTGPTSFESSNQYGTAAGAATKAQQTQAELGSAGGQQQILKDNYGVYGQGNTGLDFTLLQNSGANPILQQQAKNYGGIQDYLAQQSSNLGTAAQNAQAATDAAKQQTQGAFANSLTDFQTGINAKTDAARTAATTQSDKLKSDFASGDPAKVVADLKEANPNVDEKTITDYLTALNKQSGSPTSLSQFYNYNPATAVTTGNAATKDDYDRAAALQKLTGSNFSGVLDPNNAAQAGTTPSALSGISTDNIGDYLKGKFNDAALGHGNYNPATPATPGVPGLPSTPATGATVTSKLPGMEKVPIPQNASPETVQAFNDIFGTPLVGGGTYHEGALYDAATRVVKLKALAASGAITPEEYNSYAQPIINMVSTYGSGATGNALYEYNKGKQYFANAIK